MRTLLIVCLITAGWLPGCSKSTGSDADAGVDTETDVINDCGEEEKTVQTNRIVALIQQDVPCFDGHFYLYSS